MAANPGPSKAASRISHARWTWHSFSGSPRTSCRQSPSSRWCRNRWRRSRTFVTYFQSWGNEFTDAGVQQLVRLQQLDQLYPEEQTLTVEAFAFATRLPRLDQLGVTDVPLSGAELEMLRRRLPGVHVG
jgi:hypothetical protein